MVTSRERNIPIFLTIIPITAITITTLTMLTMLTMAGIKATGRVTVMNLTGAKCQAMGSLDTVEDL